MPKYFGKNPTGKSSSCRCQAKTLNAWNHTDIGCTFKAYAQHMLVCVRACANSRIEGQCMLMIKGLCLVYPHICLRKQGAEAQSVTAGHGAFHPHIYTITWSSGFQGDFSCKEPGIIFSYKEPDVMLFIRGGGHSAVVGMKVSSTCTKEKWIFLCILPCNARFFCAHSGRSCYKVGG